MNGDDLNEIYKLLRGSRSAQLILDARSCFLDGKMVRAHALVLEAREAYSMSRSQLLKQQLDDEEGGDKPKKKRSLFGKGKAATADAETRKAKRKQGKVLKILEAIDDVLPQLEKLAERERVRDEQAYDVDDDDTLYDTQSTGSWEETTVSNVPGATADSIVHSIDLNDDFCDAFRVADRDEELVVIARHFGFVEVNDESDIHVDSIYYIRTSDRTYLIRTKPDALEGDDVTIEGALDGKAMKPFPRRRFVRLGKKKRMVLLTKRL